MWEIREEGLRKVIAMEVSEGSGGGGLVEELLARAAVGEAIKGS